MVVGRPLRNTEVVWWPLTKSLLSAGRSVGVVGGLVSLIFVRIRSPKE